MHWINLSDSQLSGHRPQYHTLSDQVQKQLKQAMALENKRFQKAYQFPVNQEFADIHYKANWFGMRTSNQNRVCPCCLERIKEKQFGFWETSMRNNFLSTDIILFFNFLRFLMVFFMMKLLIVDMHSMWLNFQGFDCGGPYQKICVPKLFPRLASSNRMSDHQSFHITDLLNLTFIIASIAFWTIYERYSYKKLFIDVSAQIQTEDDYSIFAEDIPVIQDINEGVIDYRKTLRQYFNNIIKEWLQNPQEDELYESYVKTCQLHGHLPTNPPRIVTKINLCWNMYELSALHDLKQQIQQIYQQKAAKQMSHPELNKSQRSFRQDANRQLITLNSTEVQLCHQFQANQKFGFALSRFLGKAFISFEYQHFAIHVIRTILTAKRFLKDVNLKVSSACFPRDVYWENLNVLDSERKNRIRTTVAITIGCLILAFLAFLGIKYFQLNNMLQLRYSERINWCLRISTSLITVIVTMILYYVIDQLSLYEQHGTKTRYQVSYLYKSISAVIFNNVFNICLAHYILKIEVWSPEGLCQQVINTLIVWYITQSLYHSMYLYWTLRWIKLKLKYRTWPILKFQNRYNEEYVLPTYPITLRYSSYLSDLYFLCFFSYLVPVSSVLGILMFFTYYYIDKFNLLKRSSYHPNYSYFLAEKATHLAQSSTLIFAAGNYLFGYVMTGRIYNPINLLSLIIAFVYLLIVWGDKKRIRCFDDYVVYETKSFTQCLDEQKFFDTYGSLNPATKLSSKNNRLKQYLGVNAETNELSKNVQSIVQKTPVPGQAGQSSIKHTKA